MVRLVQTGMKLGKLNQCPFRSVIPVSPNRDRYGSSSLIGPIFSGRLPLLRSTDSSPAKLLLRSQPSPSLSFVTSLLHRASRIKFQPPSKAPATVASIFADRSAKTPLPLSQLRSKILSAPIFNLRRSAQNAVVISVSIEAAPHLLQDPIAASPSSGLAAVNLLCLRLLLPRRSSSRPVSPSKKTRRSRIAEPPAPFSFRRKSRRTEKP